MIFNTTIAIGRMRNTSKRRKARSDDWWYFYSEGEWGVGSGANFLRDQAAFENALQNFRREVLGKDEAYVHSARDVLVVVIP